MDRVLNKDFDPESYKNSALSTFSGVFHPASCMQNYMIGEPEYRTKTVFPIAGTSYERVCASRKRRI